MARRGAPIPQELREELWRHFLDTQNMTEIARRARLSRECVRRYRVLDRWDERLDRIRRAAQNKADYTFSVAMGQNLLMVRAVKAKIGKALEELKLTEDKLADPLQLTSALEKLVKTEMLLMGGPTERVEIRSYADLVRAAASNGNGSGGPFIPGSLNPRGLPVADYA